jgi:NADH-quinone oxidoreductase subunit M
VDGLKRLLILLTASTCPRILISWPDQERIKQYYSFMLFFLLLEVGMMGVFLAQDLVLFYIFWEFTLVPMYFLIGVWGGERRIYAAVKFFLFTMAGSILMLLAIIFLAGQAHTFAMDELINSRELFAGAQTLLFLAFGIAFAIKVPMFPLHTWLPDAHVEAPTAGSVILAGVLLKMGTYGFLRFNLPLFPERASSLPGDRHLAVIGNHLRRVGQLPARRRQEAGRLFLGQPPGLRDAGHLRPEQRGHPGSICKWSTTASARARCLSWSGILYERRPYQAAQRLRRGVEGPLPLFGGISLIVVLSSMGLPGLNGFVGEFTILLGSFGSEVLGFFFTFFATLGVIMAAIYLLYMFQKIYMGPLDKKENEELKNQPLTWQELAALIPLLLLVFWIGLAPTGWFAAMDSSVGQLVAQIAPFVQIAAGGG